MADDGQAGLQGAVRASSRHTPHGSTDQSHTSSVAATNTSTAGQQRTGQPQRQQQQQGDQPSSRQDQEPPQSRRSARAPIPSPSRAGADSQGDRLRSPQDASPGRRTTIPRPNDAGASDRDPRAVTTGGSGGSRGAENAGRSMQNSRDPRTSRAAAAEGPGPGGRQTGGGHASPAGRDVRGGRSGGREAAGDRDRDVTATRPHSSSPRGGQRDHPHHSRSREPAQTPQRLRDGSHRDRYPSSGRDRTPDGSRGGRDREREREVARERGGRDRKQQDRERSRDRDRERRVSDAGGSSKGKAAAGLAGAAASDGGPFAVVDKFLAQQKLVEEVLLPTPLNVNTVHVPGSELPSFISVQQWLQETCETRLAILTGSFVLVRSQDLPELCSRDVIENCGYGRRSSSKSFAAAVVEAIPWRLRQIESVRIAPGAGPQDAELYLQGGGRVRASAVGSDQICDVPEYEYLCCELADLQDGKVMKPLRVYDIAHIAWRMRVCGDLESAIENYKQTQAKLREHGYDAEFVEEAGRGVLAEIQGIIKKFPPVDWVDGQIMQYVELNPFARPECPQEAREAINQDQVSSLMRMAKEAWRCYVALKLKGQAPMPITQWVPWKPLLQPDLEPAQQQQQQPAAGQQAPAAAVAVPQQQYGAAAAAGGGVTYQQAGQYDAGMGMLSPGGQQQQVAGVPGMQGYMAAPGAAPAAAAAAAGNGFDASLGAQQQQQQQQQRGLGLLDIADDLYADDYSFYDDPLAPASDPLLQGLPSGSGAYAAGIGAAAAVPGSLPKGLLGAGMSLNPSPSGAGLLGVAPGGTAGGTADYQYWVERGNQAAASTDPQRARAAAGLNALAGLQSDAGLTGALGPMWGGQKPPPGMADAGLKMQQQQRGEREEGGGRRSVLDRIAPPAEAPPRGLDTSAADARQRRQSGRSRSRSAEARCRRFVSPSTPGGRSGSPLGRDKRRAGAKEEGGPSDRRQPDRGGERAGGDPAYRGRRGDRGQSPPPAKGRTSSRPGRSASPGKVSRDRDRGHNDDRGHKEGERDSRGGAGSPSRRDARDGDGKRRRDGEGAPRGPAGGRDPSPEPGHKRSRREGADHEQRPDKEDSSGGLPARDIEAVARRFGGRLEGAADIFADLQLQRDVKTWLRQLAQFLGPPPHPLEQPSSIELKRLARSLPLPEHVKWAYGGMEAFVQQRPELVWGEDRYHMQLLPKFHAELLESNPSPAPGGVGGEGDVSDPEEYRAEHRGSKQRKGSSNTQGRQDRGGDQQERQPFGYGARSSRDGAAAAGAAAAAAAAGGGGASGGRTLVSPTCRGCEGGPAGAGSNQQQQQQQQPAPPGRAPPQEGRYDMPPRGPPGGSGGRGGGRGRGGMGGPPDHQQRFAAPPLDQRIAQMALGDFGQALARAVDGGRNVSAAAGYELLPLPLKDRVKPSSDLTLDKLLQDYYPEFELRRAVQGGPMSVQRHLNPCRMIRGLPCRFWNPLSLTGCRKGPTCDYKHDLVPSQGHFDSLKM